MAAKKKSIKNDYAPLFRILYWSAISISFAAVAWMAVEAVLTATTGIQKHQRMNQQYRQAMQQDSSQAVPGENSDPKNAVEGQGESQKSGADAEAEDEDKPSSTGDDEPNN